MSLTIIAGNRLECLVDECLRRMSLPHGPFGKRFVVVQNRGMERHLRMEMAQRRGVCCGVDFPFPVTLAYRLFSMLVPDLPRNDGSSQEAMTWRILSALEHLPPESSDEVFKPVRDYLRGGNSLKTWQLAREIARTFDRYLIFRTEMIRSWEAGSLNKEPIPHEEWQAILWRAIWKEADCHRVRALDHFRDALARPDVKESLPSELSFFAVASLPRFYTDIFTEIAEILPVTFYLLEPSPEYVLTEQAAGNLPSETSISWNEAGADYRRRLVATADAVIPCFARPTGERVLDLLQNDFFGESSSPEVWRKAILDDISSLQVHCCHGPVREMEVLQDVLLDILQNRPDIEPRDILVMMPDPGSRSGYASAVLESSTPKERRIPFNLVAHGLAEAEPVVETFFRLLELPRERFSASNVLSLLECQAIRDRFGLNESDRALATDWFTRAGARWAIDGANKSELGLPPIDDFTWSSAAMRLALGYALPEEEHSLFLEVAQLGMAEGTGAIVLGRFLEFLTTLISALAPLGEEGSMTEWRNRFDALIDRLFAGPDAEPLLKAKQALSTMESESRIAGYSGQLNLQAITGALRERLATGTSSAGLFSGKTTFTNMQALRGVPFKVVAVIGLDDGVFPGRDRRPGFDLMQARSRPGDPQQRADDRRVFLEAVLSAREMLILTYRGRTQEENAALPPSVIVSELLDIIDSRGRDSDNPRPSERLVRIHRLQSFHSDYFTYEGDLRFFSYSSENCQCAKGRGKESLPVVSVPLTDRKEILPDPLDLDFLRGFLASSSKFFLEKRLGMHFPWEDGMLKTTEPLDGLDALERYLCCQETLNELLAGANLKHVEAHLQKANRIPPGAPGVIALQDISGATLSLVERIHHWRDGTDASTLNGIVDLGLSCGRIQIKGAVQGVFPDMLLRWRPGSIRAKDILGAWVDLLFLSALGCGRPEALLIGKDAEKRLKCPKSAANILANLVKLLQRGMREPLPFFPMTSNAYAEAIHNGKGPDKARKSAERKWFGNGYQGIPGEGDDRHFAKCFPDSNHLQEKDFQKTAIAVFIPILKHLEDVA